MMRTRTVIIALAGISFVSGCKQQQPAAPDIDITASESTPGKVTLPVVEPLLDRQAILFAASQAASNYALGRDDAEIQKQLDGKRFSIRLRFGCEGPDATSSAPRSWRFDEKRRVLSIKVMLDIEQDQLPGTASSGTALEAVEGFWIERPWMLQAGCPRAAAPSVASPASSATSKPMSGDASARPGAVERQTAIASPSQQVGIAQFFLNTEARTHRREKRAYETTQVLPEGVTPGGAGYDLLIVGRLRQLPDGRVITCRMNSPGASPSCIVSIQMDTVSIETPGGGEMIATWNGA